MSGDIICQMMVNRLVGNFKIRILKGAKKPDNILEGNKDEQEKRAFKNSKNFETNDSKNVCSIA